ncbi:hypothetical protein A2870_00760 [Candidatus Curtissbacteria bacterium RIFCSPHIGHO2_01_FULL_41_11]|uniref:Regulatory protein RecX n=1 Tax=Candidatus Curtissbacteria bacterium RIFCSPHIGHO2_01_FULL_41_11 TaxID=1797711 RepID=A0A1F5G3E8_9BACT|nr:MAG: hypothetical protein A2870_00760 [Candidatus Curtissbacteria bacterium RIFCSPHIGHO2_01_FULL_41_11]
MPKISLIEPQKKNTSRFNIFLDGKFAFGISDQSLLENNLKVGKILTEDEISKILVREQLSKLTEIATNFLSFRQRSEKEVRDHLIKKIAVRENVKFNQASESPLIEKIISKLKKYSYINDLEFAKWYVESRLRSRPRGSRLLKLELRKKGISDSIIENLLSKSDKETEYAKKALQKKIKSWQNLSNLDLKKKIYQYLISKGFDFETIKEVFAIFSNKR